MKKCISAVFVFLCVFMLSLTAIAGDSKVTPLKKGEIAPWPGVLFSNEAAADVVATYKTLPEKIAIERKNERDKCDAECKKTVADMLARHDRKISIINARVEALESENNHVKDLLREEEKKKTNTVMWTGIGLGSGIVLTVVTVFIVQKVSE